MRSHYSAGENTDKLPSNLEELEAERAKRKKDYAQIAHEFVPPQTRVTQHQRLNFAQLLRAGRWEP